MLRLGGSATRPLFCAGGPVVVPPVTLLGTALSPGDTIDAVRARGFPLTTVASPVIAASPSDASTPARYSCGVLGASATEGPKASGDSTMDSMWLAIRSEEYPCMWKGVRSIVARGGMDVD